MSAKIDALVDYIQSSDIVYDTDGEMYEPTVYEGGFTLMHSSDPEGNLQFSLVDLRYAYFDKNNDLVINEQPFAFRKTVELPIPIF